MDEYFERASENFAVYFDPDLIDAEDDDLTWFYDLFFPGRDDALQMLLEWLDSSYKNTFHLALNIIENIIPTGEFSFDSVVFNKLFDIINSKRTPPEKEPLLFFAEKLNDIITTVFLSITCDHYQESTDPTVIASLKQLMVKIQQAQDIINTLIKEKKGENSAVNFGAAILTSWQVNNAAMATQMDSTNNAPNYVATFDNKPIAFNTEQHNSSILYLLGINAKQYLNTLVHLSNHPFIREKFMQQMRTYYLRINTSAHGQYQEASKALLQHPLMKNSRLKVDDEHIKKLIDSNDDDDDSLNDLESLYKEYLRKQKKMDETVNTKENFVNAIQSLGEQFNCEDQDIVFMVAAKNNINLCLWGRTKNNELALSANTPYATSEPIHILKQDGQYFKLKPLGSPINKNQNMSVLSMN